MHYFLIFLLLFSDTLVVKRGDSPIKLFKKTGKDYNLILNAWKRDYNRSIHPGETLIVEKDKTFERYTYINKYDEVHTWEKEGSDFKHTYRIKDVEIRIGYMKVPVKSSVYQTIVNNGGDSRLASLYTSVFSFMMDFSVMVNDGDTIEMIYTKEYKDGKFIRFGEVLMAGYHGKTADWSAYLFQDAMGRYDYYGPDGKSTKRFFLKYPCKFRRISSRFTYRRYHPIYHRYLPHYGVDFSAPIGTPVWTVGDGYVIYAGYDRHLGKVVKIRHTNGYETIYGHLSKFARGIRKGKRVSQGQVIGYVGNTGLSTGPHLHFGMKKNGIYVNPLTISTPSKRVLSKAEKKRLKEYISIVENLKKGITCINNM